jgi:hypothetical protein
VLPRAVALAASLVLPGGCVLDGVGLSGLGGLQLAADPLPIRAQAQAPAALAPQADWALRQCRPPKNLCGPTIRELEQGGFLDFRAGGDSGGTILKLLSPFAVTRIEPLDRNRCPGKLCAAHVALGGLLEDLLREGYYTLSVALMPGSAVLTLRSERIDGALKVLKGSCRFNLDGRCMDLDRWLQQDQRSGEPCGFAQTRVFVAATTAPTFVSAASFTPADAGATGGAEALRTASFDAGTVKVYELVYVHKICRSEMVLVRNG